MRSFDGDFSLQNIHWEYKGVRTLLEWGDNPLFENGMLLDYLPFQRGTLGSSGNNENL